MEAVKFKQGRLTILRLPVLRLNVLRMEGKVDGTMIMEDAEETQEVTDYERNFLTPWLRQKRIKTEEEVWRIQWLKEE